MRQNFQKRLGLCLAVGFCPYFGHKPSLQANFQERVISPNPYSAEIMQGLPRVLAMFDSDQTSDSYGYGDRYHWAWGLVDFGNGTFQGTVHGLARLWKSGFWPYATGKDAFLQRVDSLFIGASS